ncbi:MAG TPA: cation-transporting P-type ATPase [Candidatus Dormibacteraeota bacterium]|nr:cation-transporting P-type ATPase [Candidatus Dormibacteraeota bacterium]
MDNSRQLNYYRLSVDEVLDQLNSRRSGLNSREISERQERFGSNVLHRTSHELAIVTLFRQFKNLLVIMLLISATFAIYLNDIRTATILILIALLNTGVGFFQEHKAETLIESLEQLLVPKAKLLRNGKLGEADSSEVVMGDIVYIEEGDSVPADLRLIDEEELATNDFAMTGESNPSRKFVHAITSDVPLGNRHNLAFMGTTVATGHGHGIVVGIGMHTELGRIASLSQVTHSQTSPLQQEMNHLATRLAQGTVILALLLTIIALRANLGLHAALLFGIGIGAAMIPNGLVAEVNITLAQTAGRLARARALVKKLSAVETLGATNIILTDKTGTLTKNEMTVQQLLIGRTAYNVTGTGYANNGLVVNLNNKSLDDKTLKNLELFFKTAVLASNAKVSPPDAEHPTWYVLGDPTEGALITLAHKSGLDSDLLTSQHPEIREFQFDSGRKLMSSVRHYEDRVFIFVKGAPEVVLAHSHDLWDHEHIRPLTDNDRQFFKAHTESLAHQAMRNLGLAYRVLPVKAKLHDLTMEMAEKDLTFLGIASMLDPLREQVPQAMRAAQGAHIKVSIVTGDYPTTAEAIATKAHLGNKVSVILGDELSRLADPQILQLIEQGGSVFSRVSPEDKLRIVDIAKQHGQVVAVTGDGINDAPALKRADIGVAMGKTGTDVAKDASGIVLLDDSFETLIGAIEQGRLTFQNIKKAARCALTDNSGELFTILLSLAGQTIFHIPIAITAIQILAIDIIAQIFPITALGWDNAQHNLMHEEPRRLSDHIINRRAVVEFLGFGLLTAALAYSNFLLFFVRHHLSPIQTSTNSSFYFRATILTYLSIVLCQFIYLMLVRSDEHESLWTSYLWSNKKLLVAFGISFFCIANLMYNPWISSYFGAGPLSLSDWISALVCAAIYLLVSLLTRRQQRPATKSPGTKRANHLRFIDQELVPDQSVI